MYIYFIQNTIVQLMFIPLQIKSYKVKAVKIWDSCD